MLIKSKLETQHKNITENQTKLTESNRKLELTLKENNENEKVLETLLKEMKDLEEEILKVDQIK